MPSFDQCSIAEFSNSFLVSPSPSVCTINIDGWESFVTRNQVEVWQCVLLKYILVDFMKYYFIFVYTVYRVEMVEKRNHRGL